MPHATLPIAEIVSGARHQPYRLIHKALRAEMADTVCRLGRVDPLDRAATLAIVARVEDLLTLADHHLQHENAHMHPPLRERAPEAVDPFDREHADQRILSQSLRTSVDALRECAGSPPAEAAAYRLYLELSTWTAQQWRHMAEEETLLTQAFWARFRDDEIVGIEQRLVASIPPGEMMPLVGRMLRALNHPERTAWLRKMAAGMPDAAFTAVLDMARQGLEAPEWHKLAHDFRVPAVDGLVAA